MAHMAAAQASNCVLLWLPSGEESPAVTAMQFVSLRQQLEGFGEVAHVETSMAAGELPMLQVTYFDVRCAMAVMDAFGTELCSYGAQEGRRSLRIERHLLESVALADVSNVTCTAGGDFEVEFFDTRVAAQVAEFTAAASSGDDSASTAAEEAEPRHQSAGEEATELVGAQAAAATAEASASCRPRKVNSLRMSQLNWEDLTSGREWRTVLRLNFLPRRLCEPGALEALLRHHGLAELVERVRVLPARGSLGCAVVKVKSVAGVPALAKFFHGRQLGSSTPVAVCFADGQHAARAGRGAPRHAARPVHLGEPLHVKSCAQESEGLAECSDSTVSVSPRDSSDSEASLLQEEPRQAARQPLPCGVRPPPGLEGLCC